MLRARAGFGVLALVVSAVLCSCKKKPANETALASATAPSATPASPVATIGAAARALAEAPMPEGEALSALDPCVVGTWGSTLVTMKIDALHAEGGAKVRLTISDSGAAVLNFTPMSTISTAATEFALDFQYSGKASATLKTPRQGVLEIEKADYSGLRVSVRAKPHDSDRAFVMRDQPLAATSASGAAASAPSAAPAPSAEQALPGVAGIARDPVFSSGHYSCADSALMLRSKAEDVTWRFVKADPDEPGPPATP